MKKLRAAIKQNEQGEVVEVSLRSRFGFSQITNAGLVHLKDMADLKMLLLSRTRVTDAGLVYLKALSNLETLTLNSTQITDVGLVHLKVMTNLQKLYLSFTQVTDAGIAELRQALPNCEINH